MRLKSSVGSTTLAISDYVDWEGDVLLSVEGLTYKTDFYLSNSEACKVIKHVQETFRLEEINEHIKIRSTRSSNQNGTSIV